MASYPPPPPPQPPPNYDPRAQRRFQRDQFRAQRDAMRAQRVQMRRQVRGLRRGSVLAPILLIAAGIVLLLVQTGRLDHQRFWEWYGNWWPLLLVAAGAVLLAEWGFDQLHLRDPQRIPYRRSAGGGVFLLLLLMGILGVVVHEGERHIAASDRWGPGGWRFDPESLDALLGDEHESDQTLDLALPLGGSLAVVDPRGNVTVDGASDDGRIHISVHKQVYARTDSEAEGKAQRLSPVVGNDGTAMLIHLAAIEGGRADLAITVPAATATSVTADRGDIHIASIKAPVAATANHGNIELTAITGAATAHINNQSSSLSAHSMGGGIAIEGHARDVTLSGIVGPVTLTGEFFGAVHLEQIDGAIHFHTSRTDLQVARLGGEADIRPGSGILVNQSPGSGISVDQALGPLVLNAGNRNVSLDRIAGEIAVTDRNGTVELTAAPPLGAITLEDRNGSVKLVVPERAGFSVQANTTHGEIDTGFPLTAEGDEGSRSLNGTVGAGGPMVRITTTNGDISLHQGTVLPLPPDPAAPPRLTFAPALPPRAAHIGKGKDADVSAP